MVKTINLLNKNFNLIIAFILSLLIFQSIFVYVKADDTVDGPLEVTTDQNSFYVNIGESITINWSFNVPSHDYAVYWEINGDGVNKSGWGLNANCTTPAITDNGTIWTYTCNGYYAKYHVWSTVTVIGKEVGRDNDGVDGIYSQKVSPYAVNQWTYDGAAICRASGDHKNPQIVSDGAGGAIITWEESDIYAQKINSNGDIQWNINGKAICTATGDQRFPQLVTDGAGGAIITWQDSRGGMNDIYIQKVNSSGDIQWTENGMAICTVNGSQNLPQLVSDGLGGAIITWEDSRSGDVNIYAQKINSSGDLQWIANGTAICTSNGNQIAPQIVSDGLNNTIITWQDGRTSGYDIYAQKINSSGDFQWIANGIIICNATGDQLVPQIISDGFNNTIITWQDGRISDYDIYAQKVNSNGDLQWIDNGSRITMSIYNQLAPQLVGDGAGGAIITWQVSDVDYNIYAKKVNSDGTLPWATYDKAICNANGDQLVPQLVSDGAGGAIIVWDDNRFEEVDDGDDGDGDGDGDDDYIDDYDTTIPGFPLIIFIVIFSIWVLFKIIKIHTKTKKHLFEK